MLKYMAVVLVILAFYSQAVAATYKWVDENGTLHFGDKPPRDPKYKAEVRGEIVSEPDSRVDSLMSLNRSFIFKHKDQKDLSRNKILEVHVNSETDDSVVFDVKYNYVDPNKNKVAKYDYKGKITNKTKRFQIYISPLGGGAKSCAYTRASPGVNKVLVECSLSGSSMKTIKPFQTKRVRLEIAHYGSRRVALFSKTVPFEKTWKREGKKPHRPWEDNNEG